METRRGECYASPFFLTTHSYISLIDGLNGAGWYRCLTLIAPYMVAAPTVANVTAGPRPTADAKQHTRVKRINKRICLRIEHM